MKNIVLVSNFHPNEQVAHMMASLVFDKFTSMKVAATLYDLEQNRSNLFSRASWAERLNRDPNYSYTLLLRIINKHPTALICDFEDSNVGGEFPFDYRPYFMEEQRTGYYLVEFPAVYVRQENPEIFRYGKEHGGKVIDYFEKRSDWDLTRESGLCDDHTIELLSQDIIHLAAQY